MILIIDDDSAIRSSLSFMLKRAKYEVETASGPKEAIEIIRRTAPQLILMDMNFAFHQRRRRTDPAPADPYFPAGCSGYPDDCMGKYPSGRTRHAGRSF